MTAYLAILKVSLLGYLKDRVIYATVIFCLFIILLVPIFSLFSMRQVQELAITLTLSAISFFLLVLSILLGGFSISRDIERRYVGPVLGLPLSRKVYILGKFSSIVLIFIVVTAIMGAVGSFSIFIVSNQYPSEISISWSTFYVGLFADCCKYILLSSFGFLFSCVSTSFFLPVFGTLAIYFIGSSTQQVFEYVSGQFVENVTAPMLHLTQALYYILPNFSAFNFKVHAVYGLPLEFFGIILLFGYFVVYLSLVLWLCFWLFSRREFL
jgi:ABC-type transport system involved in multi-copper enzyme maturation permease subunit